MRGRWTLFAKVLSILQNVCRKVDTFCRNTPIVSAKSVHLPENAEKRLSQHPASRQVFYGIFCLAPSFLSRRGVCCNREKNHSTANSPKSRFCKSSVDSAKRLPQSGHFLQKHSYSLRKKCPLARKRPKTAKNPAQPQPPPAPNHPGFFQHFRPLQAEPLCRTEGSQSKC